MNTVFTLRNTCPVTSTVVPDIFIDEYMIPANGEFVKVYLYLLRIQRKEDIELSLSNMADVFSCTEKDILRALKYWQKVGVLKLSFDDGKRLSSLILLPYKESVYTSEKTAGKSVAGQTAASAGTVIDDAAAAGTASASASTAGTAMVGTPAAGAASTGTPAASAASTSTPIAADASTGTSIEGASTDTATAGAASTGAAVSYHTAKEIASMKEANPEIPVLLYISEQYLKKQLSVTDMQHIIYLYDDLHFSVDLIEYLISYCADLGHRSIHYIDSVAIAWHKDSIQTVKEAKQRTKAWSKTYFTILKAFGIRNRDPIPSEIEMMNRWLTDYGFSMELIKEACSRTIAQTSNPSFKYTEGILSKWKKENVRTLEDIRALDEAHAKRQKNNPGAGNKTKNEFNNFEQRDYDYNKLEEQLLKH